MYNLSDYELTEVITCLIKYACMMQRHIFFANDALRFFIECTFVAQNAETSFLNWVRGVGKHKLAVLRKSFRVV